MTHLLLTIDLVAFMNGNVFGYLLHAVEIAFAEMLFGFSLKKRKHFILRLTGASIVYLTLAVVLGLFFENVFPYLRYVITFLLSILLFLICFQANIWDELFCIVAAVAMQNLAYSTSAFVVGVMGGDPVKVDWFYSSIQVIIYVGIHIIAFTLCKKRLKDVFGAGEEKLSMVLMSFVLTIIVYVMQIGRQTLDTVDFLWWRAMFISYDVLTLFMLFGMYDRNKLRRENTILNSLRASEEKQYEFDKRAMEIVNIKCHDLKHQIIALRNMVGDEREQALKEIEDAVLIYNSVAQTGCKPLDVILSNKYLICEKCAIQFTYMVDGAQLAFMKASDVYSLFGNALDNAIRAEMNVEDKEKRIINITVAAKGGFLSIHMENYCEDEVIFQNGIPVTTKENTNYHGFGMISMKSIIEQYGGVMSAEWINHMFCLDMTIPIQESAETN